MRIKGPCRKCGHISNEPLWPFEGGMCSECVVKNFTLEKALDKTCTCLHVEITRLFGRKPRNYGENCY